VAEELLEAHAENIARLTIIPSSGGRFLVTAGEKPLFDKKEVGRFPNKGETAQLLARTL